MTDQATDRRAAILARCDELERIARAVETREGGPTWHACYRPNEAAWAWDVVTSPDQLYSGIVDGRTEETATHVATWDPAAAFALVAGARELCEIHAPDDDPHAYRFSRLPDPARRDCMGCGFIAPGEYPRFQIGECPTLAALGRMLGLPTEGGEDA